MSHGYTYVMSDVHGDFTAFNSMLRQINFKPEDTLYILGDIVDRKPDGLKILRKIIGMPNVKMLLGNHEFMLLETFYYHADEPKECMNTTEYQRLWYRIGGGYTYRSFIHQRNNDKKRFIDYLLSLPLNISVTINGKNYLLVHGGAVTDQNSKSEANRVVWERIEKDYTIENKTIIFGHTPTVYYTDKKQMPHIYFGDGKIGIDCGDGYEWGRLACLRLEDMKEFYSKDDGGLTL